MWTRVGVSPPWKSMGTESIIIISREGTTTERRTISIIR